MMKTELPSHQKRSRKVSTWCQAFYSPLFGRGCLDLIYRGWLLKSQCSAQKRRAASSTRQSPTAELERGEVSAMPWRRRPWLRGISRDRGYARYRQRGSPRPPTGPQTGSLPSSGDRNAVGDYVEIILPLVEAVRGYPPAVSTSPIRVTGPALSPVALSGDGVIDRRRVHWASQAHPFRCFARSAGRSHRKPILLLTEDAAVLL